MNKTKPKRRRKSRPVHPALQTIDRGWSVVFGQRFRHRWEQAERDHGRHLQRGAT